MDMKSSKLEMNGDIDPVDIAIDLRKICKTQLLSVRTMKKEEKKKEEEYFKAYYYEPPGIPHRTPHYRRKSYSDNKQD